MFTFDDFDAWGEAVSGANLSLTCDAVEAPRWTLGILDLGGVILQVATEGGGNLCYGANTHAGPILFVPLSHSAGHVVNGAALDEESLLAIPRGADFSIGIRRRAHAWCSIALPADIGIPTGDAAGSVRLAGPAGTVRAVRELAVSIANGLLDRPAGTAAHRRAGIELVAAARRCLPGSQPARPSAGRPPLDRRTIIRRSLESIAAAPTVPAAADLAADVGVTPRTLLRAFQDTFGIAPKQYLMLRELHRVRRLLLAGAPADATVADVLVRNGIWEFGRFAGRYRARFGELPSATLRRSRG